MMCDPCYDNYVAIVTDSVREEEKNKRKPTFYKNTIHLDLWVISISIGDTLRSASITARAAWTPPGSGSGPLEAPRRPSCW